MPSIKTIWTLPSASVITGDYRLPMDIDNSGSADSTKYVTLNQISDFVTGSLVIPDNGADSNASFLLVSSTGSIPNGRVLTAGSNITINDTGTTLEISSSGGGGGGGGTTITNTTSDVSLTTDIVGDGSNKSILANIQGSQVMGMTKTTFSASATTTSGLTTTFALGDAAVAGFFDGMSIIHANPSESKQSSSFYTFITNPGSTTSKTQTAISVGDFATTNTSVGIERRKDIGPEAFRSFLQTTASGSQAKIQVQWQSDESVVSSESDVFTVSASVVTLQAQYDQDNADPTQDGSKLLVIDSLGTVSSTNATFYSPLFTPQTYSAANRAFDNSDAGKIVFVDTTSGVVTLVASGSALADNWNTMIVREGASNLVVSGAAGTTLVGPAVISGSVTVSVNYGAVTMVRRSSSIVWCAGVTS